MHSVTLQNLNDTETFTTEITHEGKPTTVTARYREVNGQISFVDMRDHLGNFLSVGMSDQKVIRQRIRQERGQL